MRKIVAVISALCVLFSSAAFAQDLSAMTDEEILGLYQSVLHEMTRRGIPAEPSEDAETESAYKRVIEFFSFWNMSDYDKMLSICDSGWKMTVDDPRTELFRILANRTPMDATIESVNEIAGEGPDGLTYDLVTLTSHLDRNDGTGPNLLRFSIIVRKEEDGLWYINPTGFETWEDAEEDTTAEADSRPEDDTPVMHPNTFLYYVPNGGEYYHLDQNCGRVHEKYLPMHDCFPYSELNDEPYRTLKSCEICGAPLRPEEDSPSETGK